jgi:hypothetical protein
MLNGERVGNITYGFGFGARCDISGVRASGVSASSRWPRTRVVGFCPKTEGNEVILPELSHLTSTSRQVYLQLDPQLPTSRLGRSRWRGGRLWTKCSWQVKDSIVSVTEKEVSVTQLRKQMQDELLRRNYSESTIRTYLHSVEEFAKHFGKRPDRLGAAHIREYQAYLLKDRKLAVGTVVLRVSALRFLFIKTLKRRNMKEDLPYPKHRRRLPTILS